METDFFNLQIIPVKQILTHEAIDFSRAPSLARQLKRDKVLCNPIIVANLGNKKYIQLDGMNRLSAFQLLGFSSILCQIVDYQDMDNVELASWLHLIENKMEVLQKKIRQIRNLEFRQGKVESVKNRYIQSEGRDRICSLVSIDFEVLQIYFVGSLVEKTKMLNRIVSLYSKKIIRDVLPEQADRQDLISIFQSHQGSQSMVVFPTFTRHQIIKVVKKGEFLPPGVTRHIIKKRCLNVDLPLTFFSGKDSVEAKNRKLEKILLKRKFRLYEEPTVYFE